MAALLQFCSLGHGQGLSGASLPYQPALKTLHTSQRRQKEEDIKFLVFIQSSLLTELYETHGNRLRNTQVFKTDEVVQLDKSNVGTVINQDTSTLVV